VKVDTLHSSNGSYFLFHQMVINLLCREYLDLGTTCTKARFW